MNIVIYARHSDEKQDGSTEDQIARLEKWAKAKGYRIVEVFKDEALSGEAIIQRSGMAALTIKRCFLGKDKRPRATKPLQSARQRRQGNLGKL